jgi:hypothetical protein
MELPEGSAAPCSGAVDLKRPFDRLFWVRELG